MKSQQIPAKWRFRLWIIRGWLDSKEGKKMFDKIKAFGAGYRTYGIVAVFILCILAEKVLGWDIPGFDAQADWLQYLLGALGVGSLRAAIPANKNIVM